MISKVPAVLHMSAWLCVLVCAVSPLRADLLPDPAPQAATAPAETAYQKALDLRAAGKLVEAESVLNEALHLNPENPAYHFELANIYAMYHDQMQSGKADGSNRLLERVAYEFEQTIMLDPSFLPAKYNLGVTYKRLGRFERAREVLREVCEDARARGEGPTEFNALMQVGATYEEQGFFDEAEDIYLKAKNLDYYNPGIQGALEDLNRQRVEDQERQTMESYTRAMDYGRGFGYSPLSHAADQQMTRRAGENSAGGMQQALPYLGMMLVQQFMNKGGSALNQRRRE